MKPNQLELEAMPLATRAEAQRWNPLTRIGFRFFFIYVVLYCFPDSLEFIPGTSTLIEKYDQLWHRFVPWVGEKLFHVAITVFPNGSGDTTYNYVQVFILGCIAVLGAVLWSAIQWRRRSHPALHKLLHITVRYILGMTLLSYGMAKVIKSQFPSANLFRLTSTYGDSSPMGLLWTFMGYSRGYNLYAGLVEAGGGLLLFFRRTTLLGALISIAMLSNVVALNFFYDVPVKLYSMHLLAFALFVAFPDLSRIICFFCTCQITPPSNLKPLIPWRSINWLWQIAKTGLVCLLVYSMAKQNIESMKLYGDDAPRTALYGIYNVEKFALDGKVIEPLMTDASRWREVIVAGIGFDGLGILRVRKMNDVVAWYRYTLDESARTLTLSASGRPSATAPSSAPSGEALAYSQPDPQHVVLHGKLSGQAIEITLRKKSEDQYLLWDPLESTCRHASLSIL